MNFSSTFPFIFFRTAFKMPHPCIIVYSMQRADIRSIFAREDALMRLSTSWRGPPRADGNDGFLNGLPGHVPLRHMAGLKYHHISSQGTKTCK
jgi:hypothetical protein